MRSIPNIIFAMIWFTEQLPENYRSNLPDYLVFIVDLAIDVFNELFAKPGVTNSLTVRIGNQPSAASKAISLWCSHNPFRYENS